jgi:hypothetical protein
MNDLRCEGVQGEAVRADLSGGAGSKHHIKINVDPPLSLQAEKTEVEQDEWIGPFRWCRPEVLGEKRYKAAMGQDIHHYSILSFAATRLSHPMDSSNPTELAPLDPYAFRSSPNLPTKPSQHESQGTVVAQEVHQPDQTVNNPALGSLMHSESCLGRKASETFCRGRCDKQTDVIGLGAALFIRMPDEPSISFQSRNSFVKRGEHGGFDFEGDWPEIASKANEVSRQWTSCADELGIQAGMTRACQTARNNARTLDKYICAIDPVIHLIPEGSRATLTSINGLMKGIPGAQGGYMPETPHLDLSHWWSKDEARDRASGLDSQVVEASLVIYRQQQDYEKATGMSGETAYASTLKPSSSKV